MTARAFFFFSLTMLIVMMNNEALFSRWVFFLVRYGCWITIVPRRRIFLLSLYVNDDIE